MSADGVALGILELEHIARGLMVSDVVVKKAPIHILRSTPVSGGRFLVFLRGGVAEMEESMAAGRELAGDALFDSLLLPFASDALWPLMVATARGSGWAGDDASESVAIVETSSVCASIHAADAALKCAPVTVRDMQLAVGVSGKAFFTMTGRLFDVEAAAQAARDVVGTRLVDLQLIAQPADEIRGKLIIP